MTNTQYVVFTFIAPRKRVQPVFLTDSADTVTTAGQDLVRICLMTDIPDQMIERCIVNIVQSDRQFDDPQSGGKMAAGLADTVEQVLTQLTTQGRELLFGNRRNSCTVLASASVGYWVVSKLISDSLWMLFITFNYITRQRL